MAANPARVFTAFDYDHDEGLRNLLVGQSRHSDSPFEMHDWSVKDPFSGDWKARVRTKIRSVDQVIIICGQYTHLLDQAPPKNWTLGRLQGSNSVFAAQDTQIKQVEPASQQSILRTIGPWMRVGKLLRAADLHREI